jgi:hypothetical protein
MNLGPSFSQLVKVDAGAPRPNAPLAAREFPQYSFTGDMGQLN